MSDAGRDVAHWSQVAGEWIAWARTPGHDAFWAYQRAVQDFIGRGEGRALDVGCGEGRVSRLLTRLGYGVTAVDPVAEMVHAAEQAQSAAAYAVAPAHELPFDDGSFDLILAYNVLMDVEDLSAAVAELTRVLDRNGTLIVSIVHPVADLELTEDDEEPRQSYFDERRFETTAEDRGLRMRFSGWARPLSAYCAALTEAGLAITSLHEPAADPEGRGDMDRWTVLPLFLWMKARR